MKTSYTFSAEEEMRDDLDGLAHKHEISRSELIRLVVRWIVENPGNLPDIKEQMREE